MKFSYWFSHIGKEQDKVARCCEAMGEDCRKIRVGAWGSKQGLRD